MTTMNSPSSYEIAIVIIAAITAIAGAISAVAASRSAHAASEAGRSANRANDRAMLREISAVAASILGTLHRVNARVTDLILQYKCAEAYSGSMGNSGLLQRQEDTRNLQAEAESFSVNAKLFTNGSRRLAASEDAADFDRVFVNLNEDMQQIQAILDELDRRYADISGQNAQRRGIDIQSLRSKVSP